MELLYLRLNPEQLYETPEDEEQYLGALAKLKWWQSEQLLSVLPCTSLNQPASA
jgi:hypothetical protein